jgi:DNA processing protein
VFEEVGVPVEGEQAAVLALVGAAAGSWSAVASLIDEAGSAQAILDGRPLPLSTADRKLAGELAARVDEGALTRAATLISDVRRQGARLVTVLDDGYPLNLRQVYNPPPFLWVRGELRSADRRAIAVVGTRQATERGRTRAAEVARDLAAAGFTVVSGLALGVDAAAHAAVLEAGGRTIAVIGTGILAPTYPRPNRDLDAAIARSGAVVSQFWPTAPPRPATFPLRNTVMSGLSLGTVVIEAAGTSGAKMQARFALEHGKRLFLLDTLVETQDWARRYAQRPGVLVIRDASEVISVAGPLADTAYQATLAF